MTPPQIKPAAFWLVVQCFNQLSHRVPKAKHLEHKINLSEFKTAIRSHILLQNFALYQSTWRHTL